MLQAQQYRRKHLSSAEQDPLVAASSSLRGSFLSNSVPPSRTPSFWSEDSFEDKYNRLATGIMMIETNRNAPTAHAASSTTPATTVPTSNSTDASVLTAASPQDTASPLYEIGDDEHHDDDDDDVDDDDGEYEDAQDRSDLFYDEEHTSEYLREVDDD